MDAVIARIGGQAHVRDDEPLRRKLTGIVIPGGRPRPLGRGRHHIDAGLHLTDSLIDRECGDDVGVQRLRGRDLAGPDLDALLVAEVGQFIARQAALEVAAQHRVDQVAIADTENVHRHRRRVDADQWDAFLAGARQHIGAAGEAHERLAVAHIDVELGRLRQRLLHGRRQAGAQVDRVALAVLEAFDAKLLFFGGQRGAVGAGQRHEGVEVHPLGEVFRELEAGARRGRVRIHAVVQQPEALFIAQLFILAADIRDLLLIE